MIDLIKEIENLKDIKYGWDYDLAIDDCLKRINQYNIITAPKEIKLSEIVSKFAIKDSFYINHRISVFKDNNDIDIWEYYDIEVDETILSQSNLLVVITNNKIEEINISYRHECLNKWLYTLWIAGTTIIDDLEVQYE